MRIDIKIPEQIPEDVYCKNHARNLKEQTTYVKHDVFLYCQTRFLLPVVLIDNQINIILSRGKLPRG